MRTLLTLTAVIEMGAGMALMCCPSTTVELLLRSGLDTSAAVTVGRVAATALFALGVACWLARHDAQSGTARGLVSAMALYNLGAVVILGAAGVRSQPAGAALWPAVVLHTVMTAWCIRAFLDPGETESS